MSSSGTCQTTSLKDAFRTLELLSERYPPQTKTVDVASLEPGRILAEDIEAETDIPAVRTSSVNGFATMVSYIGTKRRIVGLSTVLSPYYATLLPGECVRISSGGVVPNGADTVVPHDDVALTSQDDDEGVETVEFEYPLGEGDNIREKGSEAKAGDVILHDGQKIDSMAIGLLHALQMTEIEIYRKARVCVLSIEDDTTVKIKKTGMNMTRAHLLALFQAQKFKAIDAGAAMEKHSEVEEKLRIAADFACAIVTIGGQTVLRKLAKDINLTTDIQRISANPGDYTFAHGKIDGKPVFVCMFPDNLDSSWIGANLFVAPVLKAVEGQIVRSSPRFKAKLTKTIPQSSQIQFLRARTESVDGVLTTTPVERYAILGANSIIEVLPTSKTSVGDRVTVLLIETLPFSYI
ncbi:unnamed protein product [Caenorhabditis sp. 36 PRJEB53466]|nr:unnamed protein product [Caenorhabditis sp. 36 PRJEB53466]